MKIQHFRNATMVLEVADEVILIDPMLGAKGTIPPFAFIRFKARRNPIVQLPDVCKPTLERVTHCLITHNHIDHLDKEAEKYLIEKHIPVTCSALDEETFRKKGLNITQTLEYWNRVDFLVGIKNTAYFVAGQQG